MADKVITLTIPEAKVAKAVEGFLRIYPNTQKDADGNPVYTDEQWIKERIRQLVLRDIKRGLQVIANDNARVIADDEMVGV